jgi:hypothetical protein
MLAIISGAHVGLFLLVSKMSDAAFDGWGMTFLALLGIEIIIWEFISLFAQMIFIKSGLRILNWFVNPLLQKVVKF